MLTIHKSYIQSMENGKVRLITPVTESLADKCTEHDIWVEVDSRYESYLCSERCDAMICGLLHYALVKGHDIQSEMPISQKLYFNLQSMLIPLLCDKKGKFYKKISLLMDYTDVPLASAHAVGTGISLGIDSLYTICKHSNGSSSPYPLTHLLMFNVGSHGNGKEASETYQKHLQSASEFAKEYNYELVSLNSNYGLEFRQHYYNVHPFAAAFAVFSLQKLWSVYLYASAGYSKMSISFPVMKKTAGANLMPILNGVFVNENMQFCADAEGVSRFEKSSYLSDKEMAQKYLYVCTRDTKNCCCCGKCTRTILSLRVLGKIKDFASVFPPEKCNIAREIHLLLKKILKRDTFCWEIIAEYFKRKS